MLPLLKNLSSACCELDTFQNWNRALLISCLLLVTDLIFLIETLLNVQLMSEQRTMRSKNFDDQIGILLPAKLN